MVEEPEYEPVAATDISLVLSYEKVPFETKKSRKTQQRSSSNFHLNLGLVSGEEVCESLLAVIQSHAKWA